MLYRGLWRDGESVYRCEVKGKQVNESLLKECWEDLRVVERLDESKVRVLAKRQHLRLRHQLEECLYPVNPPLVVRTVPAPTEHEIELLHRWRSVWDSVWAYTGSLFPEVTDWKYAKHEPGEYPYQSVVDLWQAGLVSSNNGLTWRLHAGPKAEIVWEGKL